MIKYFVFLNPSFSNFNIRKSNIIIYAIYLALYSHISSRYYRWHLISLCLENMIILFWYY